MKRRRQRGIFCKRRSSRRLAAAALICGAFILAAGASRAGGMSGGRTSDAGPEISLTADSQPVHRFYTSDVAFTVSVSSSAPLVEIRYEVLSDGTRTQEGILWEAESETEPLPEESSGSEETTETGTEPESGYTDTSAEEIGSEADSESGYTDTSAEGTESDVDSESLEPTAPESGGSEEETESGTESEPVEPTAPEPVRSQECRFIVDAAANDSDDVRVRVTASDADGGERTEEQTIRICTEAPSISVKISGKAVSVRTENGEQRGYFPGARDAEVTIRDRASAFDRESAARGLRVEGGETGEWEEDGDIHRVRIHFPAGAACRWSVRYRNLAGLEAGEPKTEGDTPFCFTLDDTSPQAMLTAGREGFSDLPAENGEPLVTAEDVQIEAAGKDALSPVRLETYVSSGDRLLTERELAGAAFEEYRAFTLDREGTYRVWLRVTDAAGNRTYAGSRTVLIDRTPCRVRIAVPGGTGAVYTGDVLVDVTALEENTASGLRSLTWQVCSEGEETQSGEFLSAGDSATQNRPLTAGGRVIVSAEKNNSDHILFSVRAEDCAGNVTESRTALAVDITPPRISVRFGDDVPLHGSYFRKARLAEITITERSSHFREKRAEKGLKIHAVDGSGREIRLSRSRLISDWIHRKGRTPDEDTHTVSVLFPGDANYRFRAEYTDEAGNRAGQAESSSPAPWQFTVDRTPPKIRVQAESGARRNSWSELAERIGFGFAAAGRIRLSGSCEDVISPQEDLQLLRTSGDRALTVEELRAADGWRTADHLIVRTGERAAVWFRAVDYAGNICYCSGDGVIADAGAPELSPEIRISGPGEETGVVSGNVRIDITAADTGASAGEYGADAGLRRVQWTVMNGNIVTRSETLFEDRSDNPEYSGLRHVWSGSVTVPADHDRSSDLTVRVTAEDRAGNRNEKEFPISIDPVPPEIQCAVTDSAGPKGIYYPGRRGMELTVKEKNFEPELCSVKVLRDGQSVPVRGTWHNLGGTGDGRTFLLRIPFREDGEYRISVSACDLAGNRSRAAAVEKGTENPWHFVIDTEAPKIKVTYDNNDVHKDRYFNRVRTARIRITDRNFVPALADIQAGVTLEGEQKQAPEIRWLTDGSSDDVFTAVVRFREDGDCTLRILAADLAGNRSGAPSTGDSAAPWFFTIDRSCADMVRISGIPSENGSPDDAEVRIADRHLSEWKIKLTRSRVLADPGDPVSMRVETECDVTDQYLIPKEKSSQAALFSLRIPERDRDGTSCDGLYRLSVRASDLAGNVWRTPEDGILFPVNRFGSVYVLGSGLAELTEGGGRFVRKVGEPLVLREYNTGDIGEIQTEVTRDGRAVPAKAEITESGGGGTWHCCTYRWDSGFFASDGVYRIHVSSRDENRHFSESSSNPACRLVFRVDTTEPEILGITGLEKKYVRAASRDVTIRAFDSLGIRSVALFDSGRRIGLAEKFEDPVHPVWTYRLRAGRYDHLMVTVTDFAGNTTDTDRKDADGRYQIGQEFPMQRTVILSPGPFMLILVHRRLLILLAAAISAVISAAAVIQRRG